ncbi:MAG: DUF308 domain-containing protein, partial [Verrucomicrobiota bacterium]
MSEQFGQKDIEEALKKMKAAWGWLIVIGIISLVGGLLCFANPFAATLTVDYIAGFIFMLVGISQIV